MEKDYIKSQGLIGVTARVRRLNDRLMSTGRNVYKALNLDIEPNWHLILLLLEQNKKMAVTEISSTLKFSHPAVIKILKKMQEKDFLIGEKDPKDQRKQLFSLSEKAISLLPEYKEKWKLIEEIQKEYFVSEFLKALEKLESKLEETPIEEKVNEFINKK
ncbi:MarR family winged helix-turn-helix transcriptional regulator [Aureivirga sp. CE67]|uniref:MarR family winged helix-turn-helix transcriptional regulator n=1 Tax=Aureivirga sp. CE67 TaxID=1788983 RepID=UPI0018CB329B|nr:MarR family transcriptional regulator [Aureivirga sp. CE67]